MKDWNRVLMIKHIALFYLAVFILCGGSVQAQIVVAHRGASFDAPENTMAAFLTAWEQNADGIEGDFYYTSDKRILCIHDADTARTGGGKKLVVSQTSFAELRKLDVGSWKEKGFAGEPIPTFDEVLQCVPAGKTFVIELKTGPEIVPLLKARLSVPKVSTIQILIIAFDPATIRACKEQMPEFRAHWLTGFKQDKSTQEWAPTAEKIAATIEESRADGVGLRGERAVVNEGFVEKLKANGCAEFHVWTIDDPRDASYFSGLGAVGITTNRPALIRESLRKSAP